MGMGEMDIIAPELVENGKYTLQLTEKVGIMTGPARSWLGYFAAIIEAMPRFTFCIR